MFNDKIYRWPKGPTNTDFLSSLKIHTKFTKNAKKLAILRVLKTVPCGETVLPDRSILIGRKIGGKC